jgi:molecular chaperone DnaK (HSP70)
MRKVIVIDLGTINSFVAVREQPKTPYTGIERETVLPLSWFHAQPAIT